MKVYFDIITNHTADVIGYEEGARTAYVSKDTAPYRTAARPGRSTTATTPAPTPSRRSTRRRRSPTRRCSTPSEKNLKVPAWLNDPTLYHNRGNTTFTGEDSQYGDFFGLDDLFTENPKVVDGFVDIYRTWVKDFGVDGFRDRHDEARRRRVLAEVRAGDRRLREGQRQAGLLHVRRGRARRQRRSREEPHLALHHPRRRPGDPRLPVPGRRPRLRLEGQRQRGAAHVLRERRLVHRRGLQRLRAADLPRQPRHGPDRLLPQRGQQGRRRRRSSSPGTGSPTS